MKMDLITISRIVVSLDFQMPAQDYIAYVYPVRCHCNWILAKILFAKKYPDITKPKFPKNLTT